MELILRRGELVNKENKTLFPWSWPWRDSTGKVLKPYQAFLSRKFAYTYLIIIWLIWLTLGRGPEYGCHIAGGGLYCIGGIWPADIVNAPLHFFSSLLIAPIFHNSNEHIIFVTFGFLLFVQSFETRLGALRTYFLFMLFTCIAALIMATLMNISDFIWPESELLAEGFSRNWMGGSAGFYGIIGASSHQSKNVWVIPAIAIGFESWNHFLHGISFFTSSAHMISLFCGFFIWGYWSGNLRRTAKN